MFQNSRMRAILMGVVVGLAALSHEVLAQDKKWVVGVVQFLFRMLRWMPMKKALRPDWPVPVSRTVSM